MASLLQCLPFPTFNPLPWLEETLPTDTMFFSFRSLSTEQGKKCVFFLVTVGACLAWAAASSTLIMLNNYLLRNDGFDYPVILCSMGQLFSWLAAAGLIYYGAAQRKMDFTWSSYFRTIVPIGIASAGSLALGNAAYLYLSVSFIQMLKSATPVITMLVMFAFGLEYPRPKLILAVIIISVACALASLGEVDMNVVGLCMVLASGFSEALKVVATEKLLGTKFSGPMEGVYHVCPATWGAMLVVTCFKELPQFIEEGGYMKIVYKPHLYFLAASLGLVVNWLTLEVIKRINSLSFKIFAQAKNVCVVILGVVMLGNTVTTLQACAYAASIGGFFLYQKAVAEKKKKDVKVVAPPGYIPLRGDEWEENKEGTVVEMGKMEQRENETQAEAATAERIV